MLYILASIVVISITVLGITKFMMWLTEKATHASLTDRFKDAEHILNEHQIPISWLTPTPLFKRVMQGKFRIALPSPEGQAEPEKAYLLTQLDDLICFFETCPFFDSEESRDAMLDELWLERDHWEQKSTHELIV